MSKKDNSIIYPLSMVAAGAGLVLLSRKLWQPLLKLEGQVVLITGGSRGLGLAMAEEFARHGARLVVCARDERELERAEAILSETGAEVMALRCDLTDRNQVLNMVKQVTTRFGRIDKSLNRQVVQSFSRISDLTTQRLDVWTFRFTSRPWVPSWRRLRASGS